MTANALRAGSLYGGSGRRKYLTQDERTRFVEAARRCERQDVMTLCLTLAYTGARISEALALTGESVEASAGFIAIRSLKKRTRAIVIREIPVPDALIACLYRVHGLDAASREARLWPYSRCRAWRLIKGVMNDAGITHGLHATPKGLRHGFGLHAIRSGVPLNLVQRWLGHARMETTAIYLQAMGEEERQIAIRMWAD
ncbi:tyrosine-type recombinase/integrase [uncultured Bradyrhizobium sp.]|uniref:tyrosine-type recombinase/integrase n=1 Tax=uncultured Bradyrhizobium sp. TaxID=199684 RepID=UPI0035CC4873